MQSEHPNDHIEIKPIKWQTAQPLLTSGIILKQLLVVLAIPVACLFVFLLFLAFVEGQLTPSLVGQYFLLALLLLGGLIFLAAIGTLIIYGNKYEYQFIVDDKGVNTATVGKTKRKNAVVNSLLLLTGRPGAAGAGLLAASRQVERVNWQDVDQFAADPAQLEIQLKRGSHVKMLIRCTPENYQAVVERVERAIKEY